MQIILLERIEKLGQMGDLVNVKPGYARNYLLPQGKALRANKANMERFESERAQREADNLTQRSEAETEAKKMDGLAVNMVRAASEMGQLFGSVTSRDIAEAVTEAGFTIMTASLQSVPGLCVCVLASFADFAEPASVLRNLRGIHPS